MISAGHAQDEIKQKYTERQLLLYFYSIHRQKNHHYADVATAINLGFAGGEDLTKYLKNLRGK